jgi:putative FmdB family regulatory protein
MPFYEYQCKNCGHELEAMQKFSDAPLKKCPHCGKSQLQRLMSAPVFRLKGAGWYETDFKDDKDKKRNLAEAPEAGSSKEADAKASDGKKDSADSKVEPASAEKPKPEAAQPAERAPQPAKAAAKKSARKVPRRSAKKAASKAKKRR